MFKFTENLQLNKYTRFRSLRGVQNNSGELVGFVGCLNGWGKGWRLYPLQIQENSDKTEESINGLTFQNARYKEYRLHVLPKLKPKERDASLLSSVANWMAISLAEFPTASAVLEAHEKAKAQVAEGKERYRLLRLSVESGYRDEIDLLKRALELLPTTYGELRGYLEKQLRKSESSLKRHLEADSL